MVAYVVARDIHAWRIALAVALPALSLGGCYRDSDDFNEKAASYICRYNDKDPDEPFLDYTRTDEEGQPQPYEGPWCEDAVRDNLSTCAQTCDYTPRKARRCLRQLKRALRKGTYDQTLPTACDWVYDCPSDAPRSVEQRCLISNRSCSTGGGGLPLGFAMLGLLGLWTRRRSR